MTGRFLIGVGGIRTNAQRDKFCTNCLPAKGATPKALRKTGLVGRLIPVLAGKSRK
jgi:hypothetical protein